MQVEHGITEMVNGNVDIVEWMLRLQLPQFLAPLDLDACRLDRSGWSIEVRDRHGLSHSVPPEHAATTPQPAVSASH